MLTVIAFVLLLVGAFFALAWKLRPRDPTEALNDELRRQRKARGR